MSIAACPGCAIGTTGAGPAMPANATVELVLPGIHCAACIGTVEKTLRAAHGVIEARVNLTRKRAWISAEPDADPAEWIEALARAGIEAHEMTPDQAARPEPGADIALHLGVAGFAMMNVMLLSVAVWSGAADVTRDFLHWISALIALPATAFAARPFFRNAAMSLRAGRLSMDVPISLAIVLACGMSLYEVANGGDDAWFDAALSLTFFLLAGRYLDQTMRRSVRSAAADLAALEPARVLRIEGDARVSRPVQDLRAGDQLWLPAGSRVPVDAVLLEDSARIDRSALTGESDPILLHHGQDLVAGDMLLTGPSRIQASAVGEDTTLRRISRLIALAETARGHYSSLAERAAAIYTPAIHLIAFATFLGWFAATGDLRQALNISIATLIITCPCALGLAIPAVSAAATGRLYRLGCLIKSDTALERLAQIDTVIFDKTGTLTRPDLLIPPELSQTQLEILRGLADASDHPLCRGLRARLRGISPATLSQVQEHPGMGVSAQCDGVAVSLFGAADGGGAVLSVGALTFGLNRVELTVDGAKDLIRRLRRSGYQIGLLTGDSQSRADQIGAELGIRQIWSGVTTYSKAALIKALQAEGRTVLMVGDGLNDAAALASAHASIAPGQALEVSRNAADVVITGHISLVGDVLLVGSRARKRMRENLMIAIGYNAVAVPLAVAGFASPLLAAIAMSVSSITVTMNALRMT